MTNQWLQPLGYAQTVLCHVSPSPSPAEVKIKALSSQAEEGSLLTAAPGCVESSFISRGNLTFAGPKEFNKDPRPPATPHTLNRSRQRWLDKLICIQARCCRWSRSADVKKPEASPLGSSYSTRHPPPTPPPLHTPPPSPRWGLGGGGGYGALFPAMDSFINQKEIAAGWEEWKEGRRGGQRLCSRVKSGLSAEGQRRVGRAVTSGRFTAAPSHLSTRDGDSRGAAATAETRSPEISQVLRCVCALGERVSVPLELPLCISGGAAGKKILKLCSR